MATKPTETLAFEPTTAVAVPSGKQTVGFLPGEKPPAQYLSWLFRTLSRLYNYVKDGNLTGNHTIAGTFDVTGNTTVTGTMGVSARLTASGGIVTKHAGLTRSIVDSLGYRQGQLTEFEEQWRGTGTSTATGTANLPLGWNCDIGPSGAGHVGSSSVIEDPSVAFPQRHLRIDLPNTAAPASEYTLWHNHMGWMSNNSSITFEMSVLFQNVGNGTNLDIGLQFDNSGSNNRYVVFEFLNGGGSPTVKGKIVGSSTATSSLATALPSNTTHTIKLEILGSSITGLTAGTFQARWVYNGTLTATATFTNPTASAFRPYAKSYSLNVGNGDTGIFLGRIRMCFNHRLDGEV